MKFAARKKMSNEIIGIFPTWDEAIELAEKVSRPNYDSPTKQDSFSRYVPTDTVWVEDGAKVGDIKRNARVVYLEEYDSWLESFNSQSQG